MESARPSFEHRSRIAAMSAMAPASGSRSYVAADDEERNGESGPTERASHSATKSLVGMANPLVFMRRHFLEIIALKQPAERLQPRGRRVRRTFKVRSKEVAEDLLAQASRTFLLPRSTTLSESIGETLQSLIESCKDNVFRIARLEGHLDGGCLLEAVQGVFELTRAFGQVAGLEKGLAEVDTEPPCPRGFSPNFV